MFCVFFVFIQFGLLVVVILLDIFEFNQLWVGVINSLVGDIIGCMGYQGENVVFVKGFVDYLGVLLNVCYFYYYDEL